MKAEQGAADPRRGVLRSAPRRARRQRRPAPRWRAWRTRSARGPAPTTTGDMVDYNVDSRSLRRAGGRAVMTAASGGGRDHADTTSCSPRIGLTLRYGATHGAARRRPRGPRRPVLVSPRSQRRGEDDAAARHPRRAAAGGRVDSSCIRRCATAPRSASCRSAATPIRSCRRRSASSSRSGWSASAPTPASARARLGWALAHAGLAGLAAAQLLGALRRAAPARPGGAGAGPAAAPAHPRRADQQPRLSRSKARSSTLLADLQPARAHDGALRHPRASTWPSATRTHVALFRGGAVESGPPPACCAPSTWPASTRRRADGDPRRSAAVIGEFLASWPLFHNAYLAGWLIGVMLALAGVVVVARNQIFIGAAVAQASTLGIALGMWAGAALGQEVSPEHAHGSLSFMGVLFAIGAALLTAGARRGPGHARGDDRLGVSRLARASPSWSWRTARTASRRSTTWCRRASSARRARDVWLFGGLAAGYRGGVVRQRASASCCSPSIRPWPPPSACAPARWRGAARRLARPRRRPGDARHRPALHLRLPGAARAGRHRALPRDARALRRRARSSPSPPASPASSSPTTIDDPPAQMTVALQSLALLAVWVAGAGGDVTRTAARP